MFTIGKLYKCPNCQLLLYPTLENAIAATKLKSPGCDISTTNAFKHLSTILHCKIKPTATDSIFMIVDIKFENKHMFIQTLYDHKIGWTIWKDYMIFNEIKPVEQGT